MNHIYFYAIRILALSTLVTWLSACSLPVSDLLPKSSTDKTNSSNSTLSSSDSSSESSNNSSSSNSDSSTNNSDSSYTNISNGDNSNSDDTADTDTTFSCQLENSVRPVKILFVVDTSGSNSSATMNQGTYSCNPRYYTCAPATDPQKVFRGGSISDFFNLYRNKTNFSWSFITFANNSTRTYISDSFGPIFSDAADMEAAITAFTKATDSGSTPYLAALDKAELTLSNDPGINSTADDAPYYYIIFLSDGYPTDALNSNGTVNQTLLNERVEDLITLAPGRIKFSTVYYSTIGDTTAANTLSTMATIGLGQFINVDTASTDTINIEDLISVTSELCY